MAEAPSHTPEVFFPPLQIEYIPEKGTLYFRTDLPANFPAGFRDLFIETEAWRPDMGVQLYSTKPRLFRVDVGGISLIRKQSYLTAYLSGLNWLGEEKPGVRRLLLQDKQPNESHIPSVRGRARTMAHQNLAIALFAKAETIRERYQLAHPDKLLYVEEPIAGFVDTTGRITMFYPYYTEVNEVIDPAVYRELVIDLNMLDIHSSSREALQVIMVFDPDKPNKTIPVLIDHEHIDIRPNFALQNQELYLFD